MTNTAQRKGLKLLTLAFLAMPVGVSANLILNNPLQDQSKKIFGGIEVKDGDEIATTTVGIVGLTNDQPPTAKQLQGMFICSGTLIGPNLVLTAAHCMSSPEMYVIFGHDMEHPVAVRAADTAVVNESYAPEAESNSNDIALLHFEGALPKGYKNAQLPAAQLKLSKGDKIVAAGYGMNAPVQSTDPADGQGSGSLRMTSLTILDSEFSLGEISFDQTNGTGVCHGDSGGPAYVMSGGKAVVVGVVNRGVANDTCATTAVFAKVQSYLPWIADASKKLVP